MLKRKPCTDNGGDDDDDDDDDDGDDLLSFAAKGPRCDARPHWKSGGCSSFACAGGTYAPQASTSPKMLIKKVAAPTHDD